MPASNLISGIPRQLFRSSNRLPEHRNKKRLVTAIYVFAAILVTFVFLDKKVFLDKNEYRNLKLSHLAESLFAYKHEEPLASGHRTTMLLGIFSTNGEKYAGRRKTVRETYLSIDEPRICMLSEYMRQVRESPNNVVCQLPYAFIIGAGRHNRPYDHDDDERLTLAFDVDGTRDAEGDCIYLNIRENMEEGKSSTYFKFGASISERYKIDYIAKIDDDTVLEPHLLLQFLQDDLPPAPFNRRYYGGSPWGSWGKSIIYAAGQFYFMSSDLAHYIGYSLSPKQRIEMKHPRHTEDADIGAMVYSNPRPIKFVNVVKHRFWHHPRKTVEEFKETWETDMSRLPGGGQIFPFSFLCPEWDGGTGL